MRSGAHAWGPALDFIRTQSCDRTAAVVSGLEVSLAKCECRLRTGGDVACPDVWNMQKMIVRHQKMMPLRNALRPRNQEIFPTHLVL